MPTKSNQSYSAMLLTKLKVCYLQRHHKNCYSHLSCSLNSSQLTAGKIILCLQMPVQPTYAYILLPFLYVLAGSAGRFSVSFEVNFFSIQLLSSKFQITILFGKNVDVKRTVRKILIPHQSFWSAYSVKKVLESDTT